MTEKKKIKKEKLVHIPKTDEELKQIAEDLWAGRIFCDRHLRRPEDAPLVFMGLMFLKKEQLKELEKEEVNFFFEYLSAATPTAVNGMPTFFSVRFLRKPETVRMFQYYEAIQKALAGVELPKEKEK